MMKENGNKFSEDEQRAQATRQAERQEDSPAGGKAVTGGLCRLLDTAAQDSRAPGFESQFHLPDKLSKVCSSTTETPFAEIIASNRPRQLQPSRL
jgi:hypothetical protein